MNLAELIRTLDRQEIQLKVEARRLWCRPERKITPDLSVCINNHEQQLIQVQLIRDEGTTIRCPFCSKIDLNDHVDGLLCVWCDRLAWLEKPDGGLVRADIIDAAKQLVDPDDLTACSKCGSLLLWQTMAGTWRCRNCDPPATASRIRKLAKETRERREASSTAVDEVRGLSADTYLVRTDRTAFTPDLSSAGTAIPGSTIDC